MRRLLLTLCLLTIAMFVFCDCTQTDPCDPNPCLNGGSCAANGTVAECTCIGGYSGGTCEIPPCEPDCAGKECGDDGCGGTCGTCTGGQACNEEGLCFFNDMAQIPAGCFDMGDAFAEGYSNELPVHEVCFLEPFEMDYHEITNAEWAACVADSGCTAPAYTGSYSRATYYGDAAYDDFPVIWVTWYQVSDYCTWAGKWLPTEAEWEYAARGGLSGNRYPWGDAISGTDANYYDSGDPWNNDTSPVEYYAPNGYGLYDMAGNVWEQVEDDYHGSYDCDANLGAYNCDSGGLAPIDGSAWVDTPRGTFRSVRGGSGGASTSGLRVANRERDDARYTSDAVGARCAR